MGRELCFIFSAAILLSALSFCVCVAGADTTQMLNNTENNSTVIFPYTSYGAKVTDLLITDISNPFSLFGFEVNTKSAEFFKSKIFHALRFFILISCVAVIICIGFSRAVAVSREPESRTMKILLTVSRNPGCLESDIISETGFSRGSISFNLKKLAKENLIRAGTYHGTTRYYPFEVSGNIEQIICAVLSQEKSREVFMLLKNSSGLTQQETADALSLTPQTVRWHLSRFDEDGILHVEQRGREKIYSIDDSAVSEKYHFLK